MNVKTCYLLVFRRLVRRRMGRRAEFDILELRRCLRCERTTTAVLDEKVRNFFCDHWKMRDGHAFGSAVSTDFFLKSYIDDATHVSQPTSTSARAYLLRIYKSCPGLYPAIEGRSALCVRELERMVPWRQRNVGRFGHAPKQIQPSIYTPEMFGLFHRMSLRTVMFEKGICCSTRQRRRRLQPQKKAKKDLIQ